MQAKAGGKNGPSPRLFFGEPERFQFEIAKTAIKCHNDFMELAI